MLLQEYTITEKDEKKNEYGSDAFSYEHTT